MLFRHLENARMSVKSAARGEGRGELRALSAMAEKSSDDFHRDARGSKIIFATGAPDRPLEHTAKEFQNGGYLEPVHPDDMAEALSLRGTLPPGEVWMALPAATRRGPLQQARNIWCRCGSPTAPPRPDSPGALWCGAKELSEPGGWQTVTNEAGKNRC
jgi:hypothetical protein